MKFEGRFKINMILENHETKIYVNFFINQRMEMSCRMKYDMLCLQYPFNSSTLAANSYFTCSSFSYLIDSGYIKASFRDYQEILLTLFQNIKIFQMYLYISKYEIYHNDNHLFQW